MNSPRTLIFAADGLLGVTHLGCLARLNESNPNFAKECENFVGASIGSLWSLLVSSQINMGKILEIGLRGLQEDLNDTFQSVSLKSIHSSMGLCECSFKIIDEVLSDVFQTNQPVTFKMHHEKFNNNLVISGYNLTKNQIEYFNHVNTPHMKLKDAVKISTSIPLMFSPVKMNGCLYIDPLVLETTPLGYFDNTEILSKTNTYVLNNMKEFQPINENVPQNIFEYIPQLFKSILQLSFSKSQNLEVPVNYLNIHVTQQESTLSQLTMDNLYYLLKLGYGSMKRYV